MPARVSSIRNLGPAMEAAFRRVGIDTAEQLREIGPDAAYRRLLENGHRAHFIGYYAMVMGLQGRPWNDCRGAEKATLRARFDALVAECPVNTDSEIERLLDEIGIRNTAGDNTEKT